MTELEHVTKAYNMVAALHTEALLENVRLQQQLDDISRRWYRALWYRIKRCIGVERGYRV